MINVSNDYIKACEARTRDSYIIVKYGLYNRKAKASISGLVASDKQPFSNLSDTFDENTTANNFITCEPNRVVLDNTFQFIFDKTKTSNLQSVGYWSGTLSTSTGMYRNNPSITYSFNQKIQFTPLTLYFQEVIESFVVVYKLENEIVFTRQIDNNKELIVETTSTSDNPNIMFDEITITFSKSATGVRYVKLNEVNFGIYGTFTNSQIKELDIIDEISVNGSDLPSNSCTLSIIDKDGEFDLLNPYNKLTQLKERQTVNVYHYLRVNGVYREVPLGSFLLKNVNSSERQTLKIECYDATYFMDKSYIGSKIYVNASIETILNDLFDYFNFTNYLIDSSVDNILLSGYIPNCDMREALRLIVEAGQCIVNVNRYGQVYISKGKSTPDKVFSRSEMASLNSQNTLYNNIIDVSEYSIGNLGNELVEVYNGQITTGANTIEFDEVVDPDSIAISYPSTTATTTISKKSCKGCIINVDYVINPTDIIIKAKIYEEKKSIKRFIKDETLTLDESQIQSVDNHLITSSNSKSIGEWKLNSGEFTYNFNCLSLPYIETGDTCTIDTKYKDYSGNKIYKNFVVSKIEYTQAIKQTIEGE